MANRSHGVPRRWPPSSAISQAAVYWFDDTGDGEVRTPRSWRLHYKEGGYKWS